MNKDEIVLASTTANGMREITQERANQAMQEQAIAFAEWIETTNWSRSTENWLWYSFDVQDTGITTTELYTLFNTNNTNNGE
jgi:hypothetical protein